MDDAIYTVLARVLSFLSAFLLLLGGKFFLTARKPDKTASGDARIPFTFRGFPNEIKILKDTFGSRMKQFFPGRLEAYARDLKLAALPLAPDDIFAAQLLWAGLLAICGLGGGSFPPGAALHEI